MDAFGEGWPCSIPSSTMELGPYTRSFLQVDGVALIDEVGLVDHHRTIGRRNFYTTSFLQVDDVALIDEVGLVDHHRDMPLDIEDISYEELLALGEQIGNVSNGLSEESIPKLMKTKIFVTSAINSEEESEDQEIDCCIICQDKFKNREKLGILQCGHEYHVDCLKKWLNVKNVCPICRSEALIPCKKDKGV